MDNLESVLAQGLQSWGPTALFAMAVLETSFLTGLLVPSGTAAAFLAALSRDDPAMLIAIGVAMTTGGWVGDTVGYGLGRWGGPRLLEGDGWTAKGLRHHRATWGPFLGRHPVYSVTAARMVSFVRTVMPMSAGISGMKPVTFFSFELPGLLLWAALYMGIGVLAGESWRLASSLLGGAWLALFAASGIVLWFRSRRRSRRGAS